MRHQPVNKYTVNTTACTQISMLVWRVSGHFEWLAHHADLDLQALCSVSTATPIFAGVRLIERWLFALSGPIIFLFPIAKVRSGVKSLRTGHQSPGAGYWLCCACFLGSTTEKVFTGQRLSK